MEEEPGRTEPNPEIREIMDREAIRQVRYNYSTPISATPSGFGGGKGGGGIIPIPDLGSGRKGENEIRREAR